MAGQKQRIRTAYVTVLGVLGVEPRQMEFDAFYREHRDGLVRLCFLTTLNVESAADAAQEAMLRAFNRWATLHDEMPLAWVRQVALNLCRSRWRRAQRELRLLPRLYSAPSPPSVRDLDLLIALRGLPGRQREAVVLRYWGDLRVEQCAAAMGVSVGAVNQHLARARSALHASGGLVSEEEMA
jgi:RNA polymerase sigma factor (sigma-70 family)